MSLSAAIASLIDGRLVFLVVSIQPKISGNFSGGTVYVAFLL